jgi:hypothetical protein
MFVIAHYINNKLNVTKLLEIICNLISNIFSSDWHRDDLKKKGVFNTLISMWDNTSWKKILQWKNKLEILANANI